MSCTDVDDSFLSENTEENVEEPENTDTPETTNVRLSRYGKSFKAAMPDDAANNARPISTGTLPMPAEIERGSKGIVMGTSTLPSRMEQKQRGMSKSASTSALKSSKMKENFTIKERRGSEIEKPKCYISEDGAEMSSLLPIGRIKIQGVRRQVSQTSQVLDEKDVDTTCKKIRESDDDDDGDDCGDDDENDNNTTLQVEDDTMTETYNGLPRKQVRDILSTIISGIYGIFLVVFGVIVPVTEPFGKPNPYFFEMFYIVLYVVSLSFFAFVQLVLLKKAPKVLLTVLKRLRLSCVRFFRRKRETDDQSTALKSDMSLKSTDELDQSSVNKSKDDLKDQVPQPNVSFYDCDQYTGSFTLRVGAVCFGIASMIHSGLYFGQYFQVYDGAAICHHPIQAIKPLLHLVFTFVQVHFIFVNSRMHILRYRTIARFGFVHLFATNICVWSRCIVVETLQALTRRHGDDKTYIFSSWLRNRKSLQQMITQYSNGSDLFIPEISCYWNSLFGQVVEAAGPYLYPCTIEYSLICAGIIYVMLGNIRKSGNDSLEDDRNLEDMTRTSTNEGTSNYLNTSRGLFMGILVTVGAIITTIAFYVLISQMPMNSTAIVLVHLSETSMYLLTTFAVIIAADRMKVLRFHSNIKGGIEDPLTFISFTGLFLFAMFSVIAASSKIHSPNGVLNILANMFMILQSSIQTVFIMAANRISAVTQEQMRKQPGREFVTFLILCNFSMWAMNTFETQMPEHNPVQMDFYGPLTWSILTHISVPLGIYFRFHSAVCLSNIWKMRGRWLLRSE